MLRSVSFALSQTPAFMVRLQIRGKSITPRACLLPGFHWYLLHLPWRDGQAELTGAASYRLRCYIYVLYHV